MPTPRVQNVAEIAEVAAKGVSVERLSVRFKRSNSSIRQIAADNGFKVYSARQILKRSLQAYRDLEANRAEA